MVVIGGGIAGLWTVASLRQRGLDAVLLERDSLGAGQSIQSQGIVHGGGKYALRRVGDVAAMQSIAAMPGLWRDHHAGRSRPDLSGATLLSDHCDLWLPRGAWWQPLLDRFGVMPMLQHTDVLAVRPEKLPRSQWPAALAAHASAVYRMREPVFATASVLAALAASASGSVLAAAEVRPQPDATGARWSAVEFTPSGSDQAIRLEASTFVLTAGAGNEDLLQQGKCQPVAMQRRPLRMFLLKGPLPTLFGHCISGGRTRLTVTSATADDGAVVWQLGGEIAERMASESSAAVHVRTLRAEVERCVPGLSLGSLRWSSYPAVRAEAATGSGRRPSGVDLIQAAENVWAAWPTKLALAPRLAEAIAEECPPPQAADPRWRAGLPTPAVATYPWEIATWNPFP